MYSRPILVFLTVIAVIGFSGFSLRARVQTFGYPNKQVLKSNN